jgi:hypothetical protein
MCTLEDDLEERLYSCLAGRPRISLKLPEKASCAVSLREFIWYGKL